MNTPSNRQSSTSPEATAAPRAIGTIRWVRYHLLTFLVFNLTISIFMGVNLAPRDYTQEISDSYAITGIPCGTYTAEIYGWPYPAVIVAQNGLYAIS